MKKFIIHWVNGTTEEITGTDISNAFMLAGYGGGALQAVDYWEESKEDSYDPTKHGAVVAITPTKEERGGSTMLTNRQIQKIIRQWKQECGITHTVLFRYSGNVLKICTDKPGIMIGCHGSTAYKYTEIFKSYDSDFEKVEFVETDGIA